MKEVNAMIDDLKDYVSDPSNPRHEADMILCVLDNLKMSIEVTKMVRDSMISYLDQFIVESKDSK